MITLIAVLRTARDEGLAEFHPTVAERLSYSTRVYEDDGVPIDGFDDAVTTALLSAAREDIEATIARRGGERIVAGTASSGDEILDRCVRWIAANGWAATARDARAASDMTTRLAAGRWDQAHGYLHLMLDDLPPLAVWGGLLTGLEPEILDALEQSDVPNAGQGRFDLDYFKARAKAFRTRRFRRGFTDDITTPGGFLRTVANLSEHSRQASGDPALFQLKTQYGIRRRAKKSSSQAMAAWLNRRCIPVGDGNVLARLDRRQLRKTYYRLDYESHRGVLPLLGHSRRVAARHYADTPANRPLHERIIEEALHDAATVARPRVVRGHELQSRSPGEVAEELDIDEGTAAEVIAGEADVFLATCTGLTNSPYAAAGTVCPRSFDGTCSRCRNALVTERTLPAIVMFKRHVEGQRTCWPPREWLRRFGQTYEAIEDCLSHFDAAEIASAEPAQTSGIGSDR